MHRLAHQGLPRGDAGVAIPRQRVGRELRDRGAVAGHQRDPGQGVLRAGHAVHRSVAAPVLQGRRQRDAREEVRVPGQQTVRTARRGERERRRFW